MRERERQQLERQLQRLKTKQRQLTENIGHATRKLHTAAQNERQKQLLHYGELLEVAELTAVDPSTLLGGLADLGQRLENPGMTAHYTTIGEPLWAAYQQRKAHRKLTPAAPTQEDQEAV